MTATRADEKVGVGVAVEVVEPDPLLRNWPLVPDLVDYPNWLRRLIWGQPYHRREWQMIGFQCYHRRNAPTI